MAAPMIVRLCSSGGLLLLWCCITARNEIVKIFTSWTNFRDVLFGAVFIYGGQFAFMLAIHYSNAGAAAIVLTTVPLWVALWEMIVNRSKPSPRMVICFLLAAVGVTLIVTKGEFDVSQFNLTGLTWAIICAVMTAGYSVQPRQLLKRVAVMPVMGSAMLFGGLMAVVAYYLAKQLVEAGLDVKIIESDPARCEELSVLLPKAEILCGDGTNEAFLRKCGIETTGAVAALTGIDEENVLIGMYIRKTWPKVKVITKVNRTSFQSIIDSMDLGSVFNPRNSASNLICRYVRAMQNSGSSSQIETLYKLVGGKAEALEFRVSEGSKLCGVPLQELKLRENLLIGCIGRGGQIIIPSGQDTIEPGDSVIVVTCSAGLGKLEDILARGPGHE